MADFRRCIYALALVALIAGFTVSASAQAFQCTSSSGVPPLVRAEGYSELLGDLVIDCTGGIPTPPNQSVPGINIAVNLDVNVTSQTTANLSSVEFLESLLLIDEPNSASNPGVPLLNCGQAAAPDNFQAGAGVCQIIGGGSLGAGASYNGTAGHPNVFQGRSFRLITGQFNQVRFDGVPIDPPGTQCAIPVNGQCHRIIRITNIRGDATAKSVVVANVTQTITAQLITNPSSGLPVGDPSLPIARVQLGLLGPNLTGGNLAFVQCTALQSQTQNIVYTFQEGFSNAFKPQSLQQVLNNGFAKPSYTYNGAGSPVSVNTPNTTAGVTRNQNVPGAVYDTESGFVNNAAEATNGDCATNPLTGTNCGNTSTAFTNVGGSALNTVLAGQATQGTRLVLRFSNIPLGSSVSVPNIVLLTNVIAGGTTGVAVLINNTSNTGFGGQPAGAGNTNVAGIVGGIAGPGIAVYEVYFANPSALEKLAVPISVSSVVNLASNQPNPANIAIAQIQGGFAPFYDPLDNVRRTAFAAGSENTVAVPNTLAIPRFLQIATPTNLYAITKCSCNLLFPFVTNAPTTGGNFDTGMAIANTSVDPGNATPTFFGFKGTPQSGSVQLWFYNRNNQTTFAEPNFLNQGNTQCTNSTTAGSCSGTLTSVPPGGMLTYVLSSGGFISNDVATPGAPVLLGASGVTGGAFQGYIIAQARFQYCHGFAFISRQGGGFDNNNLAMGYQALVLDTNSLGVLRTGIAGENDGH